MILTAALTWFERNLLCPLSVKSLLKLFVTLDRIIQPQIRLHQLLLHRCDRYDLETHQFLKFKLALEMTRAQRTTNQASRGRKQSCRKLNSAEE